MTEFCVHKETCDVQNCCHVQGVTFACINAVEQPGEGAAKPSAAAAEEAKEKESGAAEAAPAAPSVGKLGTFAFRVRSRGLAALPTACLPFLRLRGHAACTRQSVL